ncbi:MULTISPECIES: class I SAM-dependent methyltransferase [unclassified Leifsonia]|uniref:class I SAM-dependent methyltransferase n=1 Tax=unclassified Leifsonia TaxID=2663824 RepID=UPI0006F764FD|nr:MULTISPECIES: class I SAM-dependent methyltransferase [unclassified Leifsonia]KQX06399.1 hypothetical protein ASC59_00505 [Leifsonia sp. Root1293]KRA10682.1 hypothetical protein ASD61_00505 [Leifsonia sp. Root60]
MGGIEPDAQRAWIDETSYWSPKWLVPSAWHEHAPFAFWLINAIRPARLVELGTHNGFSFFVFCEALKRLGLSAEVNALDTWVGDEHAGRYSESVFESVSRISADDYPDLAILKRGFFDDFVDQTPDRSIDLLHIDGRHRLEDVRHDFTTWLPKMSSRGVVVFHDTAEHKADFGVWKFWAEVSALYPAFQFDHGHGLGVLAVGSDVPVPLGAFLSAARTDRDVIISTYHELGARVGRSAAMKRQLAIARSERDGLNVEAEDLRRDVEALSREISELRSSTSWKFTAPMRAVSGYLRPGRK